jgi:glycerophosphoryl diester phosphodiesterase
VQLDAEGVLVLWHDDTLEVAGRPGVRTRDLPLSRFPELAGAGGPVPVPSFREALALALELAPAELAMDIEIKLTRGAYREETCRALRDQLEELGASSRVVVSSFDLEAVRLMERLVPGLETGYLVVDPWGGWQELQGVHADPREPRIEWLLTSRRSLAPPGPEDLVARARAEGVRLGVWTVNRRFELFRFARAGFQMLISDEPDRARALLR